MNPPSSHDSPRGPAASPPPLPFRPSLPEPPASRPVHADLTYTLVLFVVALVPRLLVALAWAREPVWDGHYYHFGAERIASGLGYSEDVTIHGATIWKPWTHYPVGYSGLLSIAYRVFGSNILTAPIVNAILGALLSVVAHRLARYAIGQNRARVAGALVALHPGLIAYSAIVMTEPAAALFVLGAAWAALGLGKRPVGVLLVGVLIGIGALIRPVSLLALPALLFLGEKPFWKSLLRTVAIGSIALLTILPWTIRNCRVMDGCALVSTNGGWNLAIGALTTTGRFRTLRADDGCPIVTGQVQQDRCWAEVGARTIARDPLHYISLIPKKLSQTYDHESFPVEYLHEAAPDLWPENRRAAGRELFTTFHWLLVATSALAPIALVTSLRRRISSRTQATLLLSLAAYISFCFASPEHPFFGLVVMTPLLAMLPFPGRPRFGPAGRVLLVLLAATTVTHAVFFGEDRYHVVVTPVLCILAAAALRRERERPATDRGTSTPSLASLP